MLLLFSVRVAEWPSELFIRFLWVFSICVCASFPFGLEGEMWDLIVLIFLIIAFLAPLSQRLEGSL